MSTGPTTDLRLAEHPAGLGFYGEAMQGDSVVHLDIMPPAYMVADLPLADPTRWSIYADGELLGLIEREEDVGPALLPLIEGAVHGASRPVMPHSRSYNTEQAR
jgi:hypothetical protein